MHKNGISALVAIFISALTISATKAQSSYTATEAYVKNAVAAEAKRADKAITNAVDAVRQETSEIYLPKAWVVDPVDATSVVGMAADAKATNREINKIADNLSSNYYTKAETDDAIDALAAYYITADASGNAFASYEALTNATVFYTGGEIRTPTRNDYCVVLSDETHGGSEWRYIYAVGEGETEGQWEAQYLIETNDYDVLSNKPRINGHTLTNDLTAANLGLATSQQVENAEQAANYAIGTANEALNVATDALAKATEAQVISTNALAMADRADAKAIEARAMADHAYLTSTNAQVISTNAQSSAGHAQSSANEAQATATVAQAMATEALSEADYALQKISDKAPLDSPEFTGTPTAPTPPAGDNSTKVATTSFVQGAIEDKTEPLLFAHYYPDGSVKSAAEFTAGIKYDAPDTTYRTITVKPFCNTGDSGNDNSGLVGRVVIPPFVDAQGNGYISDDGTRFKVVGVSGSEPHGYNNNWTTIVAPITVTSIDEQGFTYCDSLTSVSLPSATTIGGVAFSGCSALTSVSLPAATSIGDGAYYRAQITSVSLPAATSIGDGAYGSCPSLTSVSLPSATTIGGVAFSGCSALTSVSLPSVTDIGDSAFLDCTSLTSVDFGDTPRSSVPSLGNGAFNGVPSTCTIIVPDAQYNDWTAPTIPDPVYEGEIIPSPWYALVTAGYNFLKHSEWEYARRYEIAGKVDSMEEVSWEDLKLKRDNGELVPGSEYRITNYWATSNGDMNSRAVTNQFDIIVVADSTNVLNETARAIRHDGDTYFPAETRFEAWRLLYCLNNDTNRFAWAVADADGGRGVIYRMIDEFENDVPYDFKGIQFQRWAITNVTSGKLTQDAISSLLGQFGYSQNGGKCFAYQNSNISVNGTVMTVDSSTSAYYYTFDSGSGLDYSLSGVGQTVHGNKIKERILSGKAKLNNIVFLGNSCFSNTFGDSCHSNTFGDSCASNTFGNECYSNTFGNGCRSNTFGDSCFYNTFGSCNSNTFGVECNSNSFGIRCNSNTFGNSCHSNTFGNRCNSNTFGNGCVLNTFGDYCNYNAFGDYCSSNTFGTSSATKSYFRYITVESGNQYIYLNPTGTTSSSAYYQNVTIKSGVNNTTTYKTITDTNVNQNFNTTYQPKNSQVIEVE